MPECAFSNTVYALLYFRKLLHVSTLLVRMEVDDAQFTDEGGGDASVPSGTDVDMEISSAAANRHHQQQQQPINLVTHAPSYSSYEANNEPIDMSITSEGGSASSGIIQELSTSTHPNVRDTLRERGQMQSSSGGPAGRDLYMQQQAMLDFFPPVEQDAALSASSHQEQFGAISMVSRNSASQQQPLVVLQQTSPHQVSPRADSLQPEPHISPSHTRAQMLEIEIPISPSNAHHHSPPFEQEPRSPPSQRLHNNQEFFPYISPPPPDVESSDEIGYLSIEMQQLHRDVDEDLQRETVEAVVRPLHTRKSILLHPSLRHLSPHQVAVALLDHDKLEVSYNLKEECIQTLERDDSPMSPVSMFCRSQK